MLFDVFICHASEDKESVARPLANALREQHLEVWYDEFSLRVGDSLRRSIDRGLAQSRFGVVILSPSFFRKQWSQWELDGLAARQMNSEDDVILPVWHRLTAKDLISVSPSLADKLAIDASLGTNEVVRQLLIKIRPQGSTLLIARDYLLRAGMRTPVVTDDWWLDVAAIAESNDAEGGFQEAMGWGRWGFPLPPRDTTPEGRGLRLAKAAMQMLWQAEADARPITQVTPPTEVLAFIESTPGLNETCEENIRYLISYAPQLLLPGVAGRFETKIDRYYNASKEDKSIWTAENRTCGEEYALRDPDFGGHPASNVACHFVQGFAVISGPPVKYYATVDYVAWLLSDASLWLPDYARKKLIKGMKKWGMWHWSESDRESLDLGFEPNEQTGAMIDQLYSEGPISEMTPTSYRDLVTRLDFSATILALPEKGEMLAARFIESGFYESRGRKRKTR